MSLFKKIKEHEEAAPVTKATLSRSIVSTAFILTILSVAVTAYITQAWFSMNREVNNTGVQMNVEAGPNMFIENGETMTYTNYNLVTTATAHTTISFSDAPVLLVPATHSTVVTAGNPENHSTSTHGLKYLTNPSVIDRFTGMKSSTAADDPSLAEVTTNSSPQYYLDHKVLIGSTEMPLPIKAGEVLRVRLSANPALSTEPANNVQETTEHHLYQYAASVDFYVKVVDADTFDAAANDLATDLDNGNYVGTLNLANKDNHNWNPLNTTTNATANDKTYLDLITGGADVSIPCNTAETTTDCCIIVTMRYYFDGALLKIQDKDTAANNKAYVHSAYLNTEDMPALNVKFTVESAT